MLHRLLLAMALAFLPRIALAEAAPFGLPVGTATLQDVKQTEPPRESRRLVGVSHAAMASSRCC